MGAVSSTIRKAERWLLIVLMLFLTLFCFMQVFWRMVLKSPLFWSEEVSRYLYVWITFIGSAVAVAELGHFRVDVIFSFLKPKTAMLFRWFGFFCIVVFAVAMVVPGWPLLAKIARQLSPAVQISMALPYSVIPLSGVLMLYHVAEHVIADVRWLRSGAREDRAC